MGKNSVNGKTFLEKRYMVEIEAYEKVSWRWNTSIDIKILFDLKITFHWYSEETHFSFSRYSEDLELEDAVHTAILTLKVHFPAYFQHAYQLC